MAEREPVAEQPYVAEDTTPTPWAQARERLADAETYWLATTRPDWLPHLVPLLAVWVDGALCFVASPTSRKATNLARDPHCVIYGDGAPTAGPPPYEVYEVALTTAFGFPSDQTFLPTRWRF